MLVRIHERGPERLWPTLAVVDLFLVLGAPSDQAEQTFGAFSELAALGSVCPVPAVCGENFT
ncbi:hypothetical protein GCM10027590_32730 [Nocardiopsis nanhaiensis]